MIALITGKLAAKSPEYAVVDVGGVGYRVHVPLSSYYKLPEKGGDVSFHIHTHVREDAIHLFGFLTEKEKALFLSLNGVSGVGPKLALAIISGLSPEDLVSAISHGDEAAITAIPGVGKKTAARLVLELRDKVVSLGVAHPAAAPGAAGAPAREADEAVSALVNLGYKKDNAALAVRKAASKLGEDTGIETLIKEALKVLARG